MLRFLNTFVENTWAMVAEMAPYLLFGFAVAGILHVLIRREFVERWLGKPGIGGVIKASLLGVPMPLCSCSVIPVAASLRKSGATRGATISFLSSTPQTGVDSILATYALMGGVFTAVRVLVAFVCGIVTGYLIERFCPEQQPIAKAMTSSAALPEPFSPPDPRNQETKDCCAAKPEAVRRNPLEAARYGFITLPADLANALILGLLLAGAITTLMPADLLSGSMSSGLLAFFLATAISLPLYVCATASIPMAFALMAAGLSPGAALVFLITGPATNMATIATIWKMLGRKATAIYLSSLTAIAWLAGWGFNATFRGGADPVGAHHHEALHPGLWQHGFGILLLGLLLFAFWKNRRKKIKSCCGT